MADGAQKVLEYLFAICFSLCGFTLLVNLDFRFHQARAASKESVGLERWKSA